eukprot:TRINITY_DN16978_c0_g1_i1.p1 TRINITY_DN16978_c0_g1~~TRINITY_DN16978_c0_g1_i1.p1  ORF type:complete len:515 (+),score=155.01 TRINITY_DN16978_c0_g1_i1:111-1547(+)
MAEDGGGGTTSPGDASTACITASEGLPDQLNALVGEEAAPASPPQPFHHPMACKTYMVPFDRYGGLVTEECFEVPLRYTIDEKVKGLGYGAYGAVVEAFDTRERKMVAIKKCMKLFDTSQPHRTKCTLRELKLLRHFSTKTNSPDGSHPNILNATDIHIPLGNPADLNEGYLQRKDKFTEVYIVLERYTMSLRQLLDTPTEIDAIRRAYFMSQLLQGLNGIFSAKCVHRDLKPENMLINDQCALAICDLGSGRGYEENVDSQMTKLFQTTTQWYRPPESFLEDIQSDSAAAGVSTMQGVTNTLAQSADVWSCGAILAELMSGGKVLLPGKPNDILSQLRTIFTEVAPITEDDIKKLSCKPALASILRDISKEGQAASVRKKFEGKVDTAGEVYSEEEIDLLERMLKIEPSERISIDDALNHKYFTMFEIPRDDITTDHFTFRIDDNTDMRTEIWEEYTTCNPQVAGFFEELVRQETSA